MNANDFNDALLYVATHPVTLVFGGLMLLLTVGAYLGGKKR